MKTALITGISGQDGSYLAEFLLEKGYRVFGLIRRSSSENLWRIQHIRSDIHLIYGDLLDDASLYRALDQSEPDEVYNLAAQSFVGTSWAQPILTAEITGIGALRLFDACYRTNSHIRIFQASSSEMFGESLAANFSLKETSPFYPKSPYGVAKLFAHHAAHCYRESFGLFIACGISFNHESPRRGQEFVTRKITNTVAKIKLGLEKSISLGNIDSVRDWGFAGDYVRVYYAMLQESKPMDLVIGTGRGTNVRQFLGYACEAAGLDAKMILKIDPSLVRPSEIPRLVADTTLVDQTFPWFKDTRVEAKELAQMMVESDLKWNH